MQKLLVMFPSDLQGTSLENTFHWGYDNALEENQDRFMKDFWSFCEKYCSSKIEKENEHTIFVFESELETYKAVIKGQALELYNLGLVPKAYCNSIDEYIVSL